MILISIPLCYNKKVDFLRLGLELRLAMQCSYEI